MEELGKKIKDIRLSRNISLRDLAKHTGLTRSFLSQVERGKTNPSIASLERMARALNIHLSRFFEKEYPKEFSLIKRKREKRFVTKGLKTSCEVLVSDILDIAMVPLVFTLDVGGELGKSQLEVYKKERFMFTLKGKIELVCGKENKRSQL